MPNAQLPLGSKLLPRAELGVFVGYGAIEHHYKVYTPSNRQLTTSADFSFPLFLGQDKANPANSYTQQTVNSDLPTTTVVLGNPQALDVQTTVGSENHLNHTGSRSIPSSLNEKHEVEPSENVGITAGHLVAKALVNKETSSILPLFFSELSNYLHRKASMT